MISGEEKQKKPRRKKCFRCNTMKYPEDHAKSPTLNNKQIYVCSEECWKDYLEYLSGWYL